MRIKAKWWIIGIIVALVYWGQAGWAAPLQQDSLSITSPAEGNTINGEVTVLGTAALANFDSYGVLYAAGPRPTGESQWVPLVMGQKTMVVNGPLATWNTTTIPNGQYTLALAGYEVGGTEPHLFFVNNITVMNAAATPTPEPTMTPDTTTPQPTPDLTQPITQPGAIVVPTIQQPPTATPQATAVTMGTATPTADTEKDILPQIVSMEDVKSTFKIGVQLALLLYLFGGLYIAAKAAWRYYWRQERRRKNTLGGKQTG